jgi:hypothetical protein
MLVIDLSGRLIISLGNTSEGIHVVPVPQKWERFSSSLPNNLLLCTDSPELNEVHCHIIQKST